MNEDLCTYCGQSWDGGGGVYFGDGICCNRPECYKKYAAYQAEKKRQLLKALEELGKCRFDVAWVGHCKQPGSPYCEKHAGLKCVSCGAQATHDCEETGQFVCGFDLCDDCEHTIFPSGTNGGVGFNAEKVPAGLKRHCKKTEQVYKPWYARRADEGPTSAAEETPPGQSQQAG